MIGLLDVNVLVAALWEHHLHHRSARSWLGDSRNEFATCSVTQTGFVRVSSNPRAVAAPLAVTEACSVLAALCGHPRHRFLVDDVSFVESALVPHDRLVGHRQVTDAHIVAVARRHDVRVVTFDVGLARLVEGDDVVHLLATSP